MVLNILEPITSALAADVLQQVTANTDEEITVNIMSHGGEVMAGSAIIDALKLSPAKVTTKVYGVAASMASAISQAGDRRLIAEDAIFQPHNSAAYPSGRPTKEKLKEAADHLAVIDSILLKSYSKSNLNSEQLQALLIKDEPITAPKALELGFFDSTMGAVQASADLKEYQTENTEKMNSTLKALKDKFMPTAEEVVEEVVETTTAPETPARDLAADIDALTKIVEQLGAMIADLMATQEAPAAPAIEEVVEAKLTEILASIKSDETVPAATTSQLPSNETPEDGVGYLNAKQKEIQSKFTK